MDKYVVVPLRHKILLAITMLIATQSHAQIFFEDNKNKLSGTAVTLGEGKLDSIIIKKTALYPEGITFNPKTNKFIVGSFRDGAVYEIGLDGTYRNIINDKRLNSVLAIRIDLERDRILIVNSDIGASIRSYAKGSKKLASLGIYELSSGKLIHFINLGELLPNSLHLANGLALDDDGNAYVSDSFSPIIYKIDTKGNASIFLKHTRFSGKGINLNGIVYHPDGYLIVIKKGEGVLFKIPIDNPEKFSKIRSHIKFIGGDGLILVNTNELIVIANRASGKVTETAYALRSMDNWRTSNITGEYKFGNVYPTTGVVRDNKIYVVHSNLQSLMLATKEEKDELREKAVIQQIGYVKH